MTEWHLPTGFCALTPRTRLVRRLEIRHFAILQYAIERPGIMAADISRATGMSRASISTLLAWMHHDGLVEFSASTMRPGWGEVRATQAGKDQFYTALKAMRRMCDWHATDGAPPEVPKLRQTKKGQT